MTPTTAALPPTLASEPGPGTAALVASGTPSPRPLALHIDRLVLDEGALGGLRLDARGRGALQASLQTELARLLAQGGTADRLAATGAQARLQAGDLRLVAGQTPADLGRALAHQLAQALQAGHQP